MVCQELFNKIDQLKDEYLDILEDVCNIESPTNYKQGVDEVSNYFLSLARKKGFDVEVLESQTAGNALCITMNSRAKGEPIALSAHVDTVHPIGAFGYPAVKREDGKMLGPGVMDCKGGAVAAFMAMDALQSVGFKERTVKFIVQTDEEDNSTMSNKKTIAFMKEKAQGAIAFLNLEGYVQGTATIERKGILRFLFRIKGKSVHAARSYDGASAILEASHKIIELEKFKDKEGITCNCGLIKGGTTVNTVPEYCEFPAEFRFKTEEDTTLIRKFVTELASTSQVEGCSCEITQLNFRPAMPRVQRNLDLLDKMNEIYAANGLPILKGRTCTSGSDAAYITELGVACVDCLGTEGKEIHSTREYMYLQSLSESAKRIASVIYCIK